MATVSDASPVAPGDERKRALETTMKQLEKSYGKGIIMRLGDRAIEPIPVIPTGALTLDLALGIGGVPKGRVIEIYGPESSGKTTLTLHIIAQAQARGGHAAFVDAEHALDPIYAGKLGVDVANLIVSQPDNGEQALEIVEALVRSCAMDVIVVDSVAALTPRAEIDGDMGDATMGAQARLMSQALRKLTAIVSRSGSAVIFINQIRQKIGVMFGNPETTTGGNALKFYSSVRLDIRRTESLKSGDTIYGSHVRVKVVKNKVAPPFRQAEFDVLFDQGISQESCFLDAGLQYGVLNRSGTWWSYGEERIGQGRDNARRFLVENKSLAKKIESEIREKAKDALPVGTKPQKKGAAPASSANTAPPVPKPPAPTNVKA